MNHSIYRGAERTVLGNCSGLIAGAFGLSMLMVTGAATGQFVLDSALNPLVAYRCTDCVVPASPNAVQGDGKVIVLGQFQIVNNTVQSYIARLNNDGSTDASFGPQVDGGVGCVTIQPDGRILIGGGFTTVNGQSRNSIARLNPDGSLDGTFDPGTGIQGIGVSIHAITVQPDGKIVVGWEGFSTTVNGVSRKGIARLNAGGSLDTGFDPGTGPNNRIYCVLLQSDGHLIVGGDFGTFAGVSRNGLARLNANGTLDPSFDPGSVFILTFGPPAVFDGVMQPGGKLVVGGHFRTVGAGATTNVCRFNADGSLDGTFATMGTDSDVFHLASEADGSILLAGIFFRIDRLQQFGLARISAQGILDTNFAPQVYHESGGGLAVEPDGKILFGILAAEDTNRVIDLPRFEHGGALDQSFKTQVSGTGTLIAGAAQPDGSLLLAGQFNRINGRASSNFVRVTAVGALDDRFQPDVQNVNAILLQPGSQTIIGGPFQNVSGVSRTNIARLNANGSVDISFGARANAEVKSLAAQSDGSIIVGGSFSSVNNVTGRRAIARLSASGELDPSFNPIVERVSNNTNIVAFVDAIAVSGTGRIFIGGVFDHINGFVRTNIGALNPDGTIAAAFDPGPGPNGIVNQIKLQNDGSLLIGGSFSSVAGVPRNSLARLKSNGTVDAAFQTVGGQVGAFALQDDGKIWAWLRRTNYAGGDLVRLTSTGDLDSSIPSTLVSGTVNSILLPGDGSLLLLGSFSEFASHARTCLARLIIVPMLAGLEIGATNSVRFHLIGDDSLRVAIEGSPDMVQWDPIGSGLVENSWLSLTDHLSATALRRFYRARFNP